jgi:hypothetical protein
VAVLKVDPRCPTLAHLGTLAAMLIAEYDRSVTLWAGGTAMGLTKVGRKRRGDPVHSALEAARRQTPSLATNA